MIIQAIVILKGERPHPDLLAISFVVNDAPYLFTEVVKNRSLQEIQRAFNVFVKRIEDEGIDK